jgi:Holliday junction resolvasome RuvABC DNA-binding subunit
MLDSLLVSSILPASDGLVAACGPFGVRVVCASRDRDALIRLLRTRTPRPLYVELELELSRGRGELELVGFVDEERRGLYRALRGVPGVGRVSALAVLDAGEVIDTLRAVAGEDGDYFQNVPGLGPRRVRTIIGELARRYPNLPQPLPMPVRSLVEARDGLLSAGYSEAEAEDALLAAHRRATGARRRKSRS